MCRLWDRRTSTAATAIPRAHNARIRGLTVLPAAESVSSIPAGKPFCLSQDCHTDAGLLGTMVSSAVSSSVCGTMCASSISFTVAWPSVNRQLLCCSDLQMCRAINMPLSACSIALYTFPEHMYVAISAAFAKHLEIIEPSTRRSQKQPFRKASPKLIWSMRPLRAIHVILLWVQKCSCISGFSVHVEESYADFWMHKRQNEHASLQISFCICGWV